MALRSVCLRPLGRLALSQPGRGSRAETPSCALHMLRGKADTEENPPPGKSFTEGAGAGKPLKTPTKAPVPEVDPWTMRFQRKTRGGGPGGMVQEGLSERPRQALGHREHPSSAPGQVTPNPPSPIVP